MQLLPLNLLSELMNSKIDVDCLAAEVEPFGQNVRINDRLGQLVYANQRFTTKELSREFQFVLNYVGEVLGTPGGFE